MRRAFVWLTRFFARLAAPADVVQLHLIDDEQNMFQLAQKAFPPNTSPGAKLAWFSEMNSKSAIKKPRHEIYRPGQVGFIEGMKGDVGPTFLVDPGAR